MVRLNLAAVARQRAARHAEAYRVAAAAGGRPVGGSAATASDELQHLLEAVEQLRAARAALDEAPRAAAPPPQLRAMVTAQLAHGEAAAGWALHSVVADGGASEAQVRVLTKARLKAPPDYTKRPPNYTIHTRTYSER